MSEKGNLFKREYFRYFEVKDDLFVLNKPNGDVVILVLHLFPDLRSNRILEDIDRLRGFQHLVAYSISRSSPGRCSEYAEDGPRTGG